MLELELESRCRGYKTGRKARLSVDDALLWHEGRRDGGREIVTFGGGWRKTVSFSIDSGTRHDGHRPSDPWALSHYKNNTFSTVSHIVNAINVRPKGADNKIAVRSTVSCSASLRFQS